MSVERVLTQMRERVDAMRQGPARTALLVWVERLETARALDAQTTDAPPLERPPRHGVFDNRATQRRETWTLGVLGQATPAARCRSKPFGHYPDLDQS